MMKQFIFMLLIAILFGSATYIDKGKGDGTLFLNSIDSFYTYRNGSVFNEYNKNRLIVKNKADSIETTDYPYEVFSYEWGAWGVNNYQLLRFNEKEGKIYSYCNKDHQIIYKDLSKEIISSYLNQSHDFNNKFVGDNSFSFEYWKYVVIRENNKIVFSLYGHSFDKIPFYKDKNFINVYLKSIDDVCK